MIGTHIDGKSIHEKGPKVSDLQSIRMIPTALIAPSDAEQNLALSVYAPPNDLTRPNASTTVPENLGHGNWGSGDMTDFGCNIDPPESGIRVVGSRAYRVRLIFQPD